MPCQPTRVVTTHKKGPIFSSFPLLPPPCYLLSTDKNKQNKTTDLMYSTRPCWPVALMRVTSLQRRPRRERKEEDSLSEPCLTDRKCKTLLYIVASSFSKLAAIAYWYSSSFVFFLVVTLNEQLDLNHRVHSAVPMGPMAWSTEWPTQGIEVSSHVMWCCRQFERWTYLPINVSPPLLFFSFVCMLDMSVVVKRRRAYYKNEREWQEIGVPLLFAFLPILPYYFKRQVPFIIFSRYDVITNQHSTYWTVL